MTFLLIKLLYYIKVVTHGHDKPKNYSTFYLPFKKKKLFNVLTAYT